MSLNNNILVKCNWIVLLSLFCFAGCKESREDRKTALFEYFNKSDLFDKELYAKDSAYLTRRLLIPVRFIYDSSNSLFIEWHSLLIDDLIKNSFFSINNLNTGKFSFLPFVDESFAINRTHKYDSLLDENTYFNLELQKVLKTQHVKNERYFLSCVFDSLLKAEIISLDEIKFNTNAQRDSVLRILDLEKAKKYIFYDSIFGHNAYWAIVYYNDSTKVYFINGTKIRCLII